MLFAKRGSDYTHSWCYIDPGEKIMGNRSETETLIGEERAGVKMVSKNEPQPRIEGCRQSGR